VTDDEVIAELRSDSALNKARQQFSSWSARIEQRGQQRKPLSAIEMRRMEFQAVQAIAVALSGKGAHEEGCPPHPRGPRHLAGRPALRERGGSPDFSPYCFLGRHSFYPACRSSARRPASVILTRPRPPALRPSCSVVASPAWMRRSNVWRPKPLRAKADSVAPNGMPASN
jgi:hypothetical protein